MQEWLIYPQPPSFSDKAKSDIAHNSKYQIVDSVPTRILKTVTLRVELTWAWKRTKRTRHRPLPTRRVDSDPPNSAQTTSSTSISISTVDPLQPRICRRRNPRSAGAPPGPGTPAGSGPSCSERRTDGRSRRRRRRRSRRRSGGGRRSAAGRRIRRRSRTGLEFRIRSRRNGSVSRSRASDRWIFVAGASTRHASATIRPFWWRRQWVVLEEERGGDFTYIYI